MFQQKFFLFSSLLFSFLHGSIVFLKAWRFEGRHTLEFVEDDTPFLCV
jgi:hypothetical protein